MLKITEFCSLIALRTLALIIIHELFCWSNMFKRCLRKRPLLYQESRTRFKFCGICVCVLVVVAVDVTWLALEQSYDYLSCLAAILKNRGKSTRATDVTKGHEAVGHIVNRFKGSNWQYPSIGLDNGLAPNRHQFWCDSHTHICGTRGGG